MPDRSRRARAGTAITARWLQARFGARPFRVGEALASGLTYDRLRQARAAGRLIQVRRGVLLVAEAAPDPPGPRQRGGSHVGPGDLARLEAALVTSGGDAVASGRWAADLPGLPVVLGPGADRSRPAPLFLLRDGVGGKEGRRRDGSLARRARLSDDEVVVVDGIPVTSPLRTAIEIARHLPPRFGVVPLDAAMHGAFPSASRGDRAALAQAHEALDELLARQAGTIGIRQARSAARLADAWSESPLESVSRVVVVEGGLPAPEPQWRVLGAFGEEFWGDLGWPRYRLVGECDGWGKYGEAASVPGTAFKAEKRREDSLRMAGHRLLRWDWDVGVVRPHRLLGLVARALAEAGWSG